MRVVIEQATAARRQKTELTAKRIAEAMVAADKSAGPVNDTDISPLIETAIEGMAPIEQLALSADEKFDAPAATPRDVIGQISIDPSQPKTPISNFNLPTAAASSETPREVITATRGRRRWWQFWKPRDSDGARPN